MVPKSRAFHSYIFIISLLLIGAVLLAMMSGVKMTSLSMVWDSIFHYEEIVDLQLLRDVRIPRVLCTLLAGGLLGISGVLMQGVSKNPLAEPSMMGISQGATLAISLLYVNQALVNNRNIFLASFIGATLSGALVILFASRSPAHMSVGKLLLAGTALSTFFIAISTVAGILSNNSQMIGFLIAGGFQSATWENAALLFVMALFGLIVSMMLAAKINIVALGDDVAIGLGEHPGRIRKLALLLVIPLAAASVAVARNIAFVGLIVPHITKRLLGNDHRMLFPATFLTGAFLLVVADIAARLINAPYETPIGIFTSLLGVPIFLYLARKELH